jgi:hypothetical protein
MKSGARAGSEGGKREAGSGKREEIGCGKWAMGAKGSHGSGGAISATGSAFGRTMSWTGIHHPVWRVRTSIRDTPGFSGV